MYAVRMLILILGDLFISEDSNAGLHRRNFYERANEVVRCSERKTYCVLCICCLVLLITSLIIALAPLRNGI